MLRRNPDQRVFRHARRAGNTNAMSRAYGVDHAFATVMSGTAIGGLPMATATNAGIAAFPDARVLAEIAGNAAATGHAGRAGSAVARGRTAPGIAKATSAANVNATAIPEPRMRALHVRVTARMKPVETVLHAGVVATPTTRTLPGIAFVMCAAPSHAFPIPTGIAGNAAIRFRMNAGRNSRKCGKTLLPT